jgi:hypothetical protein
MLGIGALFVPGVVGSLTGPGADPAPLQFPLGEAREVLRFEVMVRGEPHGRVVTPVIQLTGQRERSVAKEFDADGPFWTYEFSVDARVSDLPRLRQNLEAAYDRMDGVRMRFEGEQDL